jgi:hypothetical protein
MVTVSIEGGKGHGEVFVIEGGSHEGQSFVVRRPSPERDFESRRWLSLQHI